ncbi:MAG: hypothetical protein WA784_17110, partial [Albidovulum sp.]
SRYLVETAQQIQRLWHCVCLQALPKFIVVDVRKPRKFCQVPGINIFEAHRPIGEHPGFFFSLVKRDNRVVPLVLGYLAPQSQQCIFRAFNSLNEVATLGFFAIPVKQQPGYSGGGIIGATFVQKLCQLVWLLGCFGFADVDYVFHAIGS